MRGLYIYQSNCGRTYFMMLCQRGVDIAGGAAHDVRVCDDGSSSRNATLVTLGEG
jgi:hypothetical protein